MIQLLFHIMGDYVTQNNWMAQKKVLFTNEGWIACWIHAFVYSLPFMFIAPSYQSWLVIFLTHFFIDKFRLAKYWIKLVNYGYYSDSPIWLSTWILIIVDNFFHITINYLSLTYLL